MADLLVILFIISLIFGAYIQWKTLNILKREHAETWVSIGQPHFINSSLQATFRLHKFIWKRHFFKLNDPKILKYCSILRGYQILYLGLLPFLFALFLLGLTK